MKKKNKKSAFLFPIIFFILLKIKNLSNDILFGCFPLVITVFSTIIHFNVEDLIHCEVFLATRFSIKDIWIYNILFVSISGYVYSNIILLSYYVYSMITKTSYINISAMSLVMNVSTLATIVALIGASTIHFADYSKTKQLIASVFAIINVISPLLLIFVGSKLVISYKLIYMNIFLSIFAYLGSYILILYSSKEKLLFNTEDYVKIYSNKFLND